MSVNIKDYKHRLEQYLNANGNNIKNKKYRCPNPAHLDKNPSCTLYNNAEGQTLTCMVCKQSWDIFDVAKLYTGANTLDEQAEQINNLIGGQPIPPKKTRKSVKEEPIKFIPLPLEKARKTFTQEKLLSMAIYANWGDKLIDVYPYYDLTGEKIIIVDARFEKENDPKYKTIISFYWNGNNVAAKNSPVVIYNQHLLKDKKPRLIVEGCKTAKAGEVLDMFTVHTWSRGTGNILKADWSIFKDEVCYFLPDDDVPGITAGQELKTVLPDLRLLKPDPDGRKLKPTKSDLFELVQIKTPEEIESYILNPNNLFQEPVKHKPEPPEDYNETNYTPLGIGDDGRAYFLDRDKRLFSTLTESLSKSKLLRLASYTHWYNEHGIKGRVNWDEAIDGILQTIGNMDFDSMKVKGRGAWADDKGNVCFHDGKSTHGDANPDYIYLRKPSIKKIMGIFTEPATAELCKKIANTVNLMTFKTPLDTVRCLCWATLAPFAGALPWRPAVLLTGKSGSGKSTIVEEVILKLCGYYIYANGGRTTPAGIQSKNGKDSTAIILEELEGDTEKNKIIRDEFFSMMTQSTSKNAPMSYKGTKDGGYVTYEMTNMFMFIGIDPTIQKEAEAKRIFTVNLDIPKTPWSGLKKEIKEVLTEKNCQAVRALTWNRLQDILNCADGIIEDVQGITQKDNRSSYAEALLLATYLIIWKAMPSFENWAEDDKIEYMKVLQKIFDNQEDDDEINEVHDLLDLYLDRQINMMDIKETRTLREMLLKIDEGFAHNEKEYRETLERYGLKIKKDDSIKYLAVQATNNAEIIRAINKGKDYMKLLTRHDYYVMVRGEKTAGVHMAGKTRRCLLFTLDKFLEKKTDKLIEE